MKNTKEPKIKTLETLLIELLQASPADCAARNAFDKMVEHFANEDFLHDTLHEKTLVLIYQKKFYAHNYAYALPLLLNLDNKAVLNNRKKYLKLFAKYYLGIGNNSQNILSRLHEALKREKTLLKRENGRPKS